MEEEIPLSGSGGRGRGKERGEWQSQEGVVSVSELAEASNESGSSKRGKVAAAGREESSSNQEIGVSLLPAGTQTEASNSSVPATGVDLASLEPHSLYKLNVNNQPTHVPEIRRHMQAPDAKISTFCSSLPPPTSTNNQQTYVAEIHQHSQAPGAKTSTFCSPLLPPTTTRDLVTGVPSVFPVALPGVAEQSVPTCTQGTGGEAAVMGETLSKAR
eukprot:c10935_g1_i1 orf=33-677(+)